MMSLNYSAEEFLKTVMTKRFGWYAMRDYSDAEQIDVQGARYTEELERSIGL